MPTYNLRSARRELPTLAVLPAVIAMWYQVFSNPEFARGAALLAVGLVVVLLALPRILGHAQGKRSKALARLLLRQWGSQIVRALLSLMPPSAHGIEIEGYSGKGPDSLPQLWQGMAEGRQDPRPVASMLDKALKEALFSGEEADTVDALLSKSYAFVFDSDPEITKGLLRAITSPMYAKLDLLDTESLPIVELEMAVAYLETMSRAGEVTVGRFLSYSSCLSHSLEMFGEYLWRLEGWRGHSA
ncbi:MAG: hypothetical protein ACOC6A_04130 [Chloroflexota bacterium]